MRLTTAPRPQDHFTGPVKPLINCFPSLLRPRADLRVRVPVYDKPTIHGLQVENINYFLDDKEGTHNVVFIGPTGSGKSRLINALYNHELLESRADLNSVSRDVCFVRGRGPLVSQDLRTRQRGVVMADTLGLCDTEIESKAAASFVIGRVSRNISKVCMRTRVLETRGTR